MAVSYLFYHFAGLVARRDPSVAGGSQLVQAKDGKVDVVDNEVRLAAHRAPRGIPTGGPAAYLQPYAFAHDVHRVTSASPTTSATPEGSNACIDGRLRRFCWSVQCTARLGAINVRQCRLA